MNTKSVLFDDTVGIALAMVKAASGLPTPVTLVRDLSGRIRILFPGNAEDRKGDDKQAISRLCQELTNSLGPYGFAPERMALYQEDLSVDVMPDSLRIEAGIFLLDRQIMGQDWLKGTFPRTTSNPRVTFYGIKGGVGRSTALVIWAWRLARQGKKVLVFDLDLESPGVSSTLLPDEASPDFGIVDWFVEDGVGQAEIVEREMTGTSPLAQGSAGDIKVVPAFGRKTGNYLPKLSRCYAAASHGRKPSEWGDRLERMVARLEEQERPDIVILDSRAGIHDIAATAITRMDADTFLFAVDSPQTWKAYSFLFQHLKQHPALDNVRNRLKVVATMVPETNREEHLKSFVEHSWDTFRDFLYDEAGPEDIGEPFSFNIDEEEGPHYPLKIYWQRALQEFNPASTGMEERTVHEALGAFMDAADSLILETEAGDMP